jgi:hypothetical protein
LLPLTKLDAVQDGYATIDNGSTIETIMEDAPVELMYGSAKSAMERVLKESSITNKSPDAKNPPLRVDFCVNSR